MNTIRRRLTRLVATAAIAAAGLAVPAPAAQADHYGAFTWRVSAYLVKSHVCSNVATHIRVVMTPNYSTGRRPIWGASVWVPAGSCREASIYTIPTQYEPLHYFRAHADAHGFIGNSAALRQAAV